MRLERRRRAASALLGRAAIPAIVRDYSGAQAMRALLEGNLEGKNVNLFEQTEGTVQLLCLETGRSNGRARTVTSRRSPTPRCSG